MLRRGCLSFCSPHSYVPRVSIVSAICKQSRALVALRQNSEARSVPCGVGDRLATQPRELRGATDFDPKKASPSSWIRLRRYESLSGEATNSLIRVKDHFEFSSLSETPGTPYAEQVWTLILISRSMTMRLLSSSPHPDFSLLSLPSSFFHFPLPHPLSFFF